jgi:hypothetical protein
LLSPSKHGGIANHRVTISSRIREIREELYWVCEEYPWVCHPPEKVKITLVVTLAKSGFHGGGLSPFGKLRAGFLRE